MAALANSDAHGLKFGSAATSFAGGLRALQANPARIATALPVAAETGAGNTGDLRAAALDVASIGPATSQAVTITFTGPSTFSSSGLGPGTPT